MRPWIIAGLLLATATAQSGGSSDPILDRLAKAGQFAFGGVGYAGAVSQGERDYKVILSRPSAKADFERLLSIGNPQAKGYALAGIRSLDPNRFRELSRSFLDSKEEVLTERGCIVSHESLGSVLNHIETGEYSRAK